MFCRAQEGWPGVAAPGSPGGRAQQPCQAKVAYVRTVTAVFGRRPLSRSTSSSTMCSLTTLGEHFSTVLTSLRHPSEHSITSSSSISAASSVAQRGRSVPRAQRTLTRLTVLTSQPCLGNSGVKHWIA